MMSDSSSSDSYFHANFSNNFIRSLFDSLVVESFPLKMGQASRTSLASQMQLCNSYLLPYR